jgi:DNA-directed RNA polymerase specialized sigma24 family protein
MPHPDIPDPLVQHIATHLDADLMRFLAKRVRNQSDARDIANEAYVRLLRLARRI